MAPPNKRTVTPHDKGWSVEAPGGKRASSVHDTQEAAIDAARKTVENLGAANLP
jgi:hypothetical protein